MYYKIPIRFQQEVILHVLKNTQERLLADGTSTILGIFGPPGEGKTVMCKQILDDLGAFIRIMSVGEFESVDAGKPVEILRKKHNEAKEFLLDSPYNISALIIDDADAAFGNWGDTVQYTVNTQTVIGELMQIANNERTRKVPIILTGNDFSKIYYPLRRSGRMSCFYWEPTPGERLDAVQMIFNWLSEDECLEVIKNSEEYAFSYNLSRPPISFYASLKGKLLDKELWEDIYARRRISDGLTYLTELSLPNYKKYSSKDIISLCKQELLLSKTSNQNYSGGIIND